MIFYREKNSTNKGRIQEIFLKMDKNYSNFRIPGLYLGLKFEDNNFLKCYIWDKDFMWEI